MEWAAEAGLRVGIVVLDARAVPAAALTMDGAYGSVFTVARAKAATALNFRASTAELAGRISRDSQHALVAVEPGFMFIAGGVPIVRDGEVVGAIGVSGGSAEQDHQCAQLALDAVDWGS